MILRYVLAWIPMIFIGIINGVLREITYGKYFSELRAHQLSTIIGILLFSLYIGLLSYFWGFESLRQALTVGVIWFGLTVAFEFIFGHSVAEQPWSKLLGDYNILAGRLWILIIIWLLVAPILFYRLLG